MKNLCLVILIIFLANCKRVDKDSTDHIESLPEIEAIIQKEIDGLYEVYIKSDLKWIDYYQDDYTIISMDGSIKTGSAKGLRDEWGKIYNKYEVILRDHGHPTILASQDQVIHYNTFDEIFITKESGDTSINVGTWIAVWKKQEDNTWKINLETYHLRE